MSCYTTQVHQFIEPASLSDLQRRFDWSDMWIDDINSEGKKHGHFSLRSRDLMFSPIMIQWRLSKSTMMWSISSRSNGFSTRAAATQSVK